MAGSPYAVILKDLESIFKCPLKPDANNSCLINIKKAGIKVQIEESRDGNLLIAVRLGIIPASRYRENVFKEALKSNRIDSSSGVFGYSKRTGDLMLFIIVDQRNTAVDNLSSIFPPFIEKAQKWTEALKDGNIPTARESEKKSGQSIFEMKR